MPEPSRPPSPVPDRTRSGLLLGLAAVLCWGAGSVVIRHLALQGSDLAEVAVWRGLLGGLVLAVWSLRVDGWSGMVGVARDRWAMVAVACYAANMLVFHLAFAHASAGVVQLLENLAPVVATVGGWLIFQEIIGRRTVVALAAAVVGVVLIAKDPGGGQWVVDGIGLALGVASGLTWGGYILALRGWGRVGKAGSAALASVAALGSAVLLLPMTFRMETGSVAGWSWLWVGLLALLSTAAGGLLWQAALRRITAGLAAILFLVTVPVTLAVGFLWLGEAPGPGTLVGAALISLAALACMVRHSRPVAPPAVTASSAVSP